LALGLPIPDALLDGAEVRAVDADISEPVIFGERSLARKTARSATSWGVMNRPVGCKLGDNEARFFSRRPRPSGRVGDRREHP
jgi:hypothetical protein